jgi:predicted RNase H-like nuclease (RuvC/YqgF family)
MSGKKDKAPAEEAAPAVLELEQLLSAMEERVSRLLSAAQASAAENVRLRAALEETAAERDRLKAELTDSLEGAVHVAELNERLSRMAVEREEVCARIERLVKSLEEPAAEA